MTWLPTFPVYKSPLADLGRVFNIFATAETPSLSRFSSPQLANAIRADGVEIRADRALTDSEIDRIAESIVSRLPTPRRRRGKVLNVEALDVEATEIDAATVDAQHSWPVQLLRRRRSIAELPTERAIRAQRLLKIIGRGRYRSTKIISIVEEMIRARDDGDLSKTFPEEKVRLRKWLKAQWKLAKSVKSNPKRKNKGQVPVLSTFDKVINSLEPVYQVLSKELHSKLALNSEVPPKLANSE
jgi:hypothetical protein